jgi:UDP:flavonoid glycosyltransferase YjiC (YdhE family)
MTVVLLAVGSRGDVAPMVALGRELMRRGAEVTVVALRDYEALVTGAGLRLVPVNASLTDAKVPATALARNARAYTSGVSGWLRQIAPQVAEAELAAVSPGDTVVAGLLSFDDADALREARGCKVIHALYAPLIPTRAGASSLAAVRPRGSSRLNRWLGSAAVAAVAGMCTTTGRALRASLGLPRTSASQFVRQVRATPTLLAAGPELLPPAPDWPATVQQTGPWLGDVPDWQPSAELAAFLDAGPPPVFVGFGSVGTEDSAAVELVARAAFQADRRVLIGAGNAPADLPPTVHVVSSAPYRWLFPRMAAVVHHGGGGTVTEALLAGVPNVAVPLGADQPFYGRRLHELGVGPAPLPRRALTADRLAALLLELTSERYRGVSVHIENGVHDAANAVMLGAGADPARR